MSTRPRTPEHFPRMKRRGQARQLRRYQRAYWRALTSARLGGFREALAGFGRAMESVAAATRPAIERVNELVATWDLPILTVAAARSLQERPYARYPFDEFVVDDNAPIVSANDLLTIACMDARHDSCEGDFCECACHEMPAIEEAA